MGELNNGWTWKMHAIEKDKKHGNWETKYEKVDGWTWKNVMASGIKEVGQHINQKKMGQWMNIMKLNNGWMQGNRAMDEFQEIENDEVLESRFKKIEQWMNLNLNNAKTLKIKFPF